jgi:hypothetical protein
MRALVTENKFDEFHALAQRRTDLIDDAVASGWPVANFFLRSGRHGLETVDELVELRLRYDLYKEAEDKRVRQATQEKTIEATLRAATAAISSQAKATPRKAGGSSRKPSSDTPIAARTKSKSELSRTASVPALPFSSEESKSDP